MLKKTIITITLFFISLLIWESYLKFFVSYQIYHYKNVNKAYEKAVDVGDHRFLTLRVGDGITFPGLNEQQVADFSKTYGFNEIRFDKPLFHIKIVERNYSSARKFIHSYNKLFLEKINITETTQQQKARE